MGYQEDGRSIQQETQSPRDIVTRNLERSQALRYLQIVEANIRMRGLASEVGISDREIWGKPDHPFAGLTLIWKQKDDLGIREVRVVSNHPDTGLRPIQVLVSSDRGIMDTLEGTEAYQSYLNNRKDKTTEPTLLDKIALARRFARPEPEKRPEPAIRYIRYTRHKRVG